MRKTGLADVLARELPPNDTALAYDERMKERVEPYYEDQALNDALRLEELRHRIFGVPLPARQVDPDRVTLAELRRAAPVDGELFRALWRLLGLLQPPDEVYGDPRVVARTRALLDTPGAIPALRQPTPDQLLLALRGG